jgi:hypothetical protein
LPSARAAAPWAPASSPRSWNKERTCKSKRSASA